MQKNIIFKSFLTVVDILLIIVVSLSFYLARPIDIKAITFVPKGNIGQIITYLEKEGFEMFRGVDKHLLWLIGIPQAGWIDLEKTRLTRGDFFYKLTTAKAATKAVIIYPGETTYITLKKLAHEFNLSSIMLQDFYNQYIKLEDGFITPETYRIPYGIKARRLIKHLKNISLTKHEHMAKSIFGIYRKKEWQRYLTIASIIQKEAGNTKEMPLIASVIYNRLKKGMPLQMDGALNYGKYSHIKVTPKRIKEDNSKFNTYKNTGLPPYPVCLVSKEAIRAAIYPAKTDFLFFVRDRQDSKGGHIFSKTFAAHNRAIKKL